MSIGGAARTKGDGEMVQGYKRCSVGRLEADNKHFGVDALQLREEVW